jgi:hypothetical protein
MINLKDKLSRLTYREACKLLGPEGEHLLKWGGKYDMNIEEQVTWEKDLLKINFGEASVTFLLTPEMPRSLRFRCSECTTHCEHLGAAFSLILEEKLSLGLSAPPPERRPVESLSDGAIIDQAIEERLERSQTEKMQLKSMDKNELWTDYTVTNRASGKSYRIALRGWERGDSYCSCPDFRKNTLGTCKHILYALEEAKRRFSPKTRNMPYKIKDMALHLRYGEETELRLLVPDDLDGKVKKLVRPFMNRPIEEVGDLLACKLT